VVLQTHKKGERKRLKKTYLLEWSHHERYGWKKKKKAGSDKSRGGYALLGL